MYIQIFLYLLLSGSVLSVNGGITTRESIQHFLIEKKSALTITIVTLLCHYLTEVEIKYHLQILINKTDDLVKLHWNGISIGWLALRYPLPLSLHT